MNVKMSMARLAAVSLAALTLSSAVHAQAAPILADGESPGSKILRHGALSAAAVPELGCWAMMILGMSMMGTGMRLRRRRVTVAA